MDVACSDRIVAFAVLERAYMQVCRRMKNKKKIWGSGGVAAPGQGTNQFSMGGCQLHNRLNNRILDAAIKLDKLVSFRANRKAALCSKTHGGDFCVYINTE